MSQPIMILELIQKCAENSSLIDSISEFNFIKSVSDKVRKRGCFCGVNQEVTNLIPQFNVVAQNLNQESVQRISQTLNKEKLCFGILENNSFKVKCY